MPWIESHTVLTRHRKLIELSKELRLKPVYAMGHLHSLWHVALEQAEDGDLSSWSDEFIADSAQYPADAPQFVRLLQKHGWLDGKLLHDWLDYAGRYLEAKYRTSNPERLSEIYKKHGRSKDGKKSVCSQTKVIPPNQTLPNLTLPNQPNQPNQPLKVEPRFARPTPEEVKAYFAEKNHPLEADGFYDHFESNGWRVSGKTPMVDWQAAARGWMRRCFSGSKIRGASDVLDTAEKIRQELRS